MEATVTVALNKFKKYPAAPESKSAVLRAVNQHLSTIQTLNKKIIYIEKIIRIINDTIIPRAVSEASTKIHKELIHKRGNTLTTFLRDKITVFQDENEAENHRRERRMAAVLRAKYELDKCVNLIKKADAQKGDDLADLPEGLLENLKYCSTSSKINIERLNFISTHGKNSDVKGRAGTLYQEYQILPSIAEKWYAYFDARWEEEWAAMEKEANLSAEQETEMNIRKVPDYRQRVSAGIAGQMTGADKTVEGGRKTRKRRRRRKRKTKKHRKKKRTRRRKPKKRHRRTRKK